MGGRSTSSGTGGGGFKSFSDLADSSFTYAGDGQEQVDFFKANSNFDELIDGMSDEDKLAFRAWCSGVFMSGQQYRGWDNMTGNEQRRTQRYDDILDRATLSSGVELTRRSDAQLVLGAGVKRPSLAALQAAEGSIITSKGSMSFGAASQGLAIGDSSKKVEYKLKIPGGSKGAGMWIGDKRINGWGPQQREFMSNRDSVFKVGKTTYDKGRGIYTTELEWMGHTAHDYGTTGRLNLS